MLYIIVLFLFLIGFQLGNIFVSILVTAPLDNSEQFKHEAIKGPNKDYATPSEKFRILCVASTTEKVFHQRSIHVKSTWGRFCDKLIFSSNKTDKRLGAVGLNLTHDDYGHIWDKFKESMSYIYRNYVNDFEWIYKADDDTFMIMENLRFLLAAYSPNDPIYFGFKFKSKEHEDSWFAGGSGYAISQKAIKLFAENILTTKHKCWDRPTNDDWGLGHCMHAAGVVAGDGRDAMKRERFLHVSPEEHLFPDPKRFYKNMSYYITDEGLDFASNYSVGIHHIRAQYMYTLYFLVYHFKVYGITNRHPPLPKRRIFSQIEFALRQERKNLTFSDN